MKYFIIGDIHGCYDELVELVDKLEINKDEDTLIFVGDYFDRGPKSYEVWKFLDGLKAELEDRCILLRGNHEQMLIDHYSGKDDAWIFNGCGATINSFELNGASPEDSVKWILDNTVYFYKNDLFTVVHAGRLSDKIEDDEIDTLLWDRNCVLYADWQKDLTFVGHTPLSMPVHFFEFSGKALKYDSLIKLPEKGIIDVDTECVYGGKLTAAEVNENTVILRYVQSKQEKES